MKKTTTDVTPASLLKGFADSGFFVLRTPLLPFEDFVRWGEMPGHANDSGLSQSGWQDNVRVLRQRLCEIIDRPEIRHALYIASPSLEASLDFWKMNPDSKKGLQTERALVRYFGRMTGRATPFGLFSGCSVGMIGRNILQLQARYQYQISLRLDFQCISALAAALRFVPEVAADLTYWPNSSLHKIGDVWHYLQLQQDGSTSSYSLVKVYNDEYLQAVLTRAQKGCSISELTQILVESSASQGIGIDEVTYYIQELIRTEVLVTELAPALTHEDTFSDLISQLDRIPSATKSANMLKSIQQKMISAQQLGLKATPAQYSTIAADLEGMADMPELSSMFQVDMVKPRENLELSQAVTAEFLRGIELLIAMGANSADTPRKLKTFRERFEHRYGHAWKPLAEVLDEETGIGVDPDDNGAGSELVRELGLGTRRERPPDVLREPYATLLHKVVENGNQPELKLRASDFPALESTPCSLPDAFSVIGAVVAKSAEAISSGDFKVVLRSGGGPSGASMLGRFCNADPELHQLVRHHLRDEESLNSEAIYAEVVHLPDPRTGNILQRPVLRHYEIAYLGRSGAAADHQISVSDLWLTVTQKGEILLYSERLGKRIIPRLTTAHAFNQRKYPSVYRFLGYLQYEHWTSVPFFSWGPLESLSFLPRVIAGKTVLSLARWRISAQEVEAISTKDRYSAFTAMQKLRQEKGLPQWVAFMQRGETLPVDLNNALSVDAFLHVLKRTGEGVLQELYPSPEELCVSGPEGRFYHEVLIPFVRQEPTVEKKPAEQICPDLQACDTSARKLPPGSNWVFFKIYAGPATLDELLKTRIPALVRSASARNLISRWFFIRYADPDLHLRLRFESADRQLSHEMLRLLEDSFNPLLHANRLWKVEVDTYEREIERYGGLEATVAAEDIFFADSQAVLEILQLLDDEIDSGLRWKIALMSLDRLFSDCSLEEHQRMEAVRMAREGYEREFQVDAANKVKLGQRFRKERHELEALLQGSANGNPVIEKARAVLIVRSQRVQQAVRKIHELSHASRLHVPLQQLVLSYIHMHVNRLMREDQRAHELILYDFLYRIYEAASARQHSLQASDVV